MKKNQIFSGIEKLILTYGDKRLMLDVSKNMDTIELSEIIELSEAEARELIKKPGVLLLNFGGFGPVSWQCLAEGYIVPLSSKTERDVLGWFYSDPAERQKGVDAILNLWHTKERANINRILRREII